MIKRFIDSYLAKIVSIFGMVLVFKRKTNHMSKNNQQDETNATNTVKNPENWTTGGEEMTGAQRSYLNTLSQEAGEETNDDLTKAEASKKIDELQQKTGRGLDH